MGKYDLKGIKKKLFREYITCIREMGAGKIVIALKGKPTEMGGKILDIYFGELVV